MPLWCNGSTDPFQGSSLGSEPGRGEYCCKKCNKKVVGKYGSGIFCSRQCANSRQWSSKDNIKKRNAAIKRIKEKGKWGILKKTTVKLKKSCLNCSDHFYVLPCYIARKFCSLKCSNTYLKQNKLIGGYREGSGRSISGYYKGIYCGSTYELVFLIYCLDKNINIKRFNKQLKDETITYIPDFIVNDQEIIEIKGFDNKNITNKKIELAKSFNYTIKVLYKEDLKPYFEYVQTTYNTKKYYELYDFSKKAFEYKCYFCSKKFTTFKERHTTTKFCSQSCAGKYRVNNI